MELGWATHPAVVDAAVKLHNDRAAEHGLQELGRLVLGLAGHRLRYDSATIRHFRESRCG